MRSEAEIKSRLRQLEEAIRRAERRKAQSYNDETGDMELIADTLEWVLGGSDDESDSR